MPPYGSDIRFKVSVLGGVYVLLVTCIQELVSRLESLRLGCSVIPPFPLHRVGRGVVRQRQVTLQFLGIAQ